MAEYGLKISKEGIDVKTGDDKDMIFHSDYPLLKGSLKGSGTKLLTSGIASTTTISHNLGYIPFIVVYIDDGYNKFSVAPVQADSPTETLTVYTKTDSNNAYIHFYWEKYGTSDSNTLKYKYFIYIDKGKL